MLDDIDAYVQCVKCNRKTSLACLDLLAAQLLDLCKKVDASEHLSHFDPKGIGQMLIDRPWANPSKSALHKHLFLEKTATTAASFLSGCWLMDCEDSQFPEPNVRVPLDFLKDTQPDVDPLVKIGVPVVELLESGEEAPMSLAEVHIIQTWPVVHESEAQHMFKGGEGTQEAYGGARLGIARAP